jgi:hypothetical protein
VKKSIVVDEDMKMTKGKAEDIKQIYVETGDDDSEKIEVKLSSSHKSRVFLQ